MRLKDTCEVNKQQVKKHRTMSAVAHISICKYPNIRSVNVISAEKVKLQLIKRGFV